MKLSTSQSQEKWFTSALCGGVAGACLILASAPSAAAQHISVGIKAGVPLTNVAESESTFLPFQLEKRRYTIGPVMDIGLPLGFGIEIGAMYKRFDQKSMTITTTGFVISPDGDSFAIQQFAGISAVGHSWEFPVAVQYHLFSQSLIRPYVEGGVSFNHLSNVYSFQNVFPMFPIGPRPLPFTDGPTRASFDRVGGLFGLGVDLKLHKIHVTPGFRYTHYNDTRQWLPSTHVVDFLVGFTI
jgi:hypothetical protein